ncbi:allergen Tha p 1-like [Coccinella septempunctata]|uniref:allergen Tha p 1-like n=1 Tax=Coccinella septempunctata TaxID=41139 RepID=UPI001D062E4E|nr:allergen Tha p 1-like [Coccinella septempunctata]XP_044745936.1 allergen Tha p 1-like [Coccinella septempunctata]
MNVLNLPVVWTLVFASLFCLMECQLGGNTYVDKQLLCALDKGPCDRLGRQVKDSLPEIIGNQCQNCTPQQLANARRIAAYVQSKYPYVWNELVDKYGRKQR